jgi:hypothetical protein
MNPAEKLMSWLREPSDPESAAEGQRLREDLDTIRISQNTGMSQFGFPTNVPPTRDVLDPGNEDSRNSRWRRAPGE